MNLLYITFFLFSNISCFQYIIECLKGRFPGNDREISLADESYNKEKLRKMLLYI